ncbi:hypothetical protein HAX54_032696, partial [Datura stramonium]|nr:hypothetical protein [Datura stramonium]
IAQSFTKPRCEENLCLAIQDNMEKMCQGLSKMLYGVNMIQIGEGPSHKDVQLIGPE